jgi:hypothetical protein
MKHLKTFESLYELPVILELKDMALELTDMFFNVQIFKDNPKQKNYNGIIDVEYDVSVIITYDKGLGIFGYGNFTMIDDLKSFLFRAIGYMKDNGYQFETHSNMGSLHFTDDGRVIISSGEARANYPSFTMINILFKK